MRFENSGRILRVELGPHVPSQGWDFNYLNQIGFRIPPNEVHSIALEFLGESVIELVAVSVTFLNGIHPGLTRTGSRLSFP